MSRSPFGRWHWTRIVSISSIHRFRPRMLESNCCQNSRVFSQRLKKCNREKFMFTTYAQSANKWFQMTISDIFKINYAAIKTRKLVDPTHCRNLFKWTFHWCLWPFYVGDTRQQMSYHKVIMWYNHRSKLQPAWCAGASFFLHNSISIKPLQLAHPTDEKHTCDGLHRPASAWSSLHSSFRLHETLPRHLFRLFSALWLPVLASQSPQ